jgi:hypothetical protein
MTQRDFCAQKQKKEEYNSKNEEKNPFHCKGYIHTLLIFVHQKI